MADSPNCDTDRIVHVLCLYGAESSNKCLLIPFKLIKVFGLIGHLGWWLQVVMASNSLGFVEINRNTCNNVTFFKRMTCNFIFSPPIDLLMVSIGIVINIYFIVMVLRCVEEMPNQQRTLISRWTE